MKRLERFDPGNVYGVPYMWGTTGIAFNVDKIKARMPDAPTDSWKMLFDPAVVKHFKDCGVALLDAGDDVVESALIYLGRNPDSENADDLQAAIDVITKIQPYLRYFHSTSYVDDLANGEICLALGYSGDVLQATRSARAGVKIDYRIAQRRRGSSGSTSWRFRKMRRIRAAAAKWIDHILDPAVVAGISNADLVREPQQGVQGRCSNRSFATTRSSIRRRT